MLQLTNNTGFAGTCFVAADHEGIDSVHTVIKATFGFGVQPTLADEQAPIAEESEYHGEPGASSLRVPSDISLIKPGTDVLLVGHAHAPGGRAVSQMDVSLTVGGLHKTLRVWGDRFWVSSGGGHAMTEPAPFRSMPLVWERAFGGADDGGMEPRNPVGIGYQTPGADVDLHGTPVPNLEDPEHPILSRRDRPKPVGVAPIDAHWEPRRSLAGTYDEAWQQSRAPFLPTDFNPYFFQLAPDGQIAGAHFRGGERIEIHGASPNGSLSFQVPVLPLRHVYVLEGESHSIRPGIDTVVLDPDQDRVMLVWRSSLQCDKKVTRVSQIIVDLVPEPRPGDRPT